MTLLEYEEALREAELSLEDVSLSVSQLLDLLPGSFSAQLEYIASQLNENILNAYQMSFPTTAHDTIVSPKVLKQLENLFKERK